MPNVFVDIPNKPFVSEIAQGQEFINAATMQMGEGSKVFRADRDGIWLGAEKFADAPFSVDMEGNMVASSATFSQYLAKADTSQTLTGDFDLGSPSSGYIRLDGANKRLLINDGTNNRGVFGEV